MTVPDEVLATARGLTVRHGETLALHDVDVALAAGEVLAVTGHTGAGKTTLLWVLAGLTQPESGEVSAPPVALVPQGSALASVLSAEENVLLPLLGSTDDAGDVLRSRAVTALADVGLEDFGSHLADELSGGQRQRVAVARALARQAPLVLADEPTSELDHTNRERVLSLLLAESRRDAAVVIATHDPEVAAACDRELHLEDGAGRMVR